MAIFLYNFGKILNIPTIWSHLNPLITNQKWDFDHDRFDHEIG